MDDYNRGGHVKYSMKMHIIFVTKYRKKLFKSDKRADGVKQFLYDVTKNYGYTIYANGSRQRPCSYIIRVQFKCICF